MEFDGFFRELGIRIPDRIFENVFKEAFAEYQKNGVFFLEDAYIRHVNTCENCLSNCLEEIIEAAGMLCSNETLAIYALFLHRAMELRKSFLEHIGTFEFPDGEDAARRLLPFIVLLPKIPGL